MILKEFCAIKTIQMKLRENNPTVLVAGSTGYLGGHIVKELKRRSFNFKAMARKPEKLQAHGLQPEQIVVAQPTEAESLSGCLKDVDVLISTIGITRQKDGLTYMDVDYQANANLLEEAKRAGVKKFVYISVLNGDQHRNLKILQAKEKFVDLLKGSGVDYIVVRPNGFYSDMGDFLDMARQGRVYLFGDGKKRLNPIHGADLANAILDELDRANTDLDVGGPDIFTQEEIGQLALAALSKPEKITHLPDWTRKLMLFFLRTFTSQKYYGPYEFFLTMMAYDQVAPRYGERRLRNHFTTEADRIKKS